MQRVILFLLLTLLPFRLSHADSPLLPGNALVKATIVSDHSSISLSVDSGRKARIGVLFAIEPGWHIYWHNSGDAAQPTRIQWTVPDGFSTGPLSWPVPYRFEERGDVKTFGYSDEVLLYSDLILPAQISPENRNIELQAKVNFLVCKEECKPGGITLSSSLKAVADGPGKLSELYKTFERFGATAPQPLSALSNNPTAFRAHVVFVSSSESFKTGSSDGVISFLLETESPLSFDQLAAQIQAFPYLNNGISMGAASISSLSGPSAEKANSSNASNFLLGMPIKIPASAPVGPTTISGVFVISAALNGTMRDRAYEWSMPILISSNSETKTTPRFEELTRLVSKTLPLEYRSVRHIETELALPDTSASEPPFLLSLGAALLSAFLAGLILNLMPCVLPIVSLKIMGFLGQHDQPRRAVVLSAIWFGLGILATFLALGVTVVVLRQYGFDVGWGFQFHEPGFVFILLIIVFILSLGFFDVYHISLPYLQKANRAMAKLASVEAKHFFDGMLATALSTPCSAPFLGTALIFAFAQPAYITLLVFLSIGAGLALPYVILASNPRLLSLVPKPGDWMYRLRQFMGFLLLGTVVWLLYVLDNQTETGVTWSLALMLVLYVFFWARDWAIDANLSGQKKLVLTVALAALFVGLCGYSWTGITAKRRLVRSYSTELIDWKPFSKDLVASSLQSGNPVFIDFTADWCITCKANEKLVIQTKEIGELITSTKTVPVKGDWTTGDEEVTRALKAYGGQGVPYYVVLKPNDPRPKILPTILTPSILSDALR